ncbi:hypothetical protein EDC56_3032 [Sinobacterium caligoides]|uniref:Uncharacterized protein n=1 Tax=Sinobacterium caligoides TaxID=933926 RepID=A0A3N2DG74_9GAMM|nr:DUF6776 family protein [Sinobacterium caligoides]ROR98797.1 hypothetical protein EDC56_3032 [Sinobacterium caligoides]
MAEQQLRPMVIHYRPRRLLLLVSLLLLILLALVFGCYWLGYDKGFQAQQQTEQQLSEVREQYHRALAQLSELQADLDNALTDNKVQHIVQQQVREEIVANESKIRELQQDVAFYRSAIDPGDESGLAVYSLDIVATEQPDRFHYRLTLIQRVARHKVLRGGLQVYVVGTQNGQVKEFPLKALSESVDSEEIELRFKYFQNIVGEMMLPQGFAPKELRVIAKSRGRVAQVTNQAYPWRVEESK